MTDIEYTKRLCLQILTHTNRKTNNCHINIAEKMIADLQWNDVQVLRVSVTEREKTRRKEESNV